MTRSSWVVAWWSVAVAVAVVGVVGLGAWARSDDAEVAPVVRLRHPVPEAVEAEVRATVADVVAVFASRRDCIGGAELELVRELEGGDARYLPSEHLIRIEIPTSPRRFRESLVHELAHHIERSCPDAEVLRADLMTAVDATSWTGQERWEDRPSELWAEAVVEIVLGERVRFQRSVPLDDGVVDAARRWIATPSG